MSGPGRPKGFSPSPETRAKLRANMLARPDMMERAMKGLEAAWKSPNRGRRRTRPPAGTPERLYFEKVRRELGSPAAHAAVRSGANA